MYIYQFCPLVYVFAQINSIGVFIFPIRPVIVGKELDERPHNQKHLVTSHRTYKALKIIGLMIFTVLCT